MVAVQTRLLLVNREAREVTFGRLLTRALMSGNDSTESSDAVYQTPNSVVAGAESEIHEELEPCREGDLGASPELSTGPVTRSGKKRKNPVPVKSSGKKKNRIMTSRTPPKVGPQPQSPAPVHAPPPEPQRPPAEAAPTPGSQGSSGPQDLAALLTGSLTSLQRSMESSMSGMESRLAGKIDNLESNVNKNKDSITLLTDMVNKNTVDLSRLESQIREGDSNFEGRVAEVVKSVMG